MAVASGRAVEEAAVVVAATTTSSRFRLRTNTATASAPVAATRARTCSPGAAASWSRTTRAAFRPLTRHSSAGNYIVLDADGTGIDYAYMHLKQKAIPREGSNVRKGEKIGEVGDTGNASGCHLHFEKWTAPGYYEGGHASRNVTKALKSWDKYC